MLVRVWALACVCVCTRTLMQLLFLYRPKPTPVSVAESAPSAVSDENHKLLLGCRSSCLSIVLSLASHSEAVVGGGLELLCSLSRTRHGRSLAIDSLDLHM